MASTWSHPIPVSRALWLRVSDGVLNAGQAGLSTLHRLWLRWQASRRRAAELRALRELSPTVLRDIGAGPESVHEAQLWRDLHSVARNNFLRGL